MLLIVATALDSFHQPMSKNGSHIGARLCDRFAHAGELPP